MTLAAEVVKWSALGKGAIIALIGGVGVVGAFGLVVMGMTGYQDARRNGRNGTALATVSLALVGGVICVGALVLGILAMIHKS